MDQLDLTMKHTPSKVSRGSIMPRTDLRATATKEIGAATNGVFADVFALYLKTKNFHWHLRSALPRLSPAARRAHGDTACGSEGTVAGNLS
jgi:hypothetical protein